MKRRQKILLALVLAVTVWVAVCFWIVGTADCVVRVSFTGLNNIFHVPYEYYVIRGGDAARIPGWILLFAGDPGAATGSKYDDKVTTQWFVEMVYMPRVEMFAGDRYYNSTPWLPTDFGENYRVYYNGWAGAKKSPDEETLAVMRRAVHYFHDGDPNKYSSVVNATGEKGLIYFIFISNGNKLLVEYGSKLYMPMDDGSFQLVMERPKTGMFDYYWFP